MGATDYSLRSRKRLVQALDGEVAGPDESPLTPAFTVSDPLAMPAPTRGWARLQGACFETKAVAQGLREVLWRHSFFWWAGRAWSVAGAITALRFQKHNPDRVNVFLDGKFAFALPSLEAARLRIGQHLADPEIARLNALDVRAKAYDRAIRYLSFRPRSTAEVRRRLAAASYGEDVIAATLARLAEQGYLDDAAFARYWVENRRSFRPKGAQALRQELRLRGLDGEVIEATLAGLDDVDGALQAARARAERQASLAAADPQTFRRRLSDFLLRRGFDYEVVREAVDRLAAELRAGGD